MNSYLSLLNVLHKVSAMKIPKHKSKYSLLSELIGSCGYPCWGLGFLKTPLPDLTHVILISPWKSLLPASHSSDLHLALVHSSVSSTIKAQ